MLNKHTYLRSKIIFFCLLLSYSSKRTARTVFQFSQNCIFILSLGSVHCLVNFFRVGIPQFCGSHHFDADPDPTCHFDADPDRTLQFEVYPDPDPARHFDPNPVLTLASKLWLKTLKSAKICSWAIHSGLSSANDADADPCGSGSTISFWKSIKTDRLDFCVCYYHASNWYLLAQFILLPEANSTHSEEGACEPVVRKNSAWSSTNVCVFSDSVKKNLCSWLEYILCTSLY